MGKHESWPYNLGRHRKSDFHVNQMYSKHTNPQLYMWELFPCIWYAANNFLPLKYFELMPFGYA